MFTVVSSTALNLNMLGTSYCTSSDAVKGIICLSAWNLPPKYGFNRWVVTVNVPFSGCVTFAPPCEKALVTVERPGPSRLQFSRKEF